MKPLSTRPHEDLSSRFVCFVYAFFGCYFLFSLLAYKDRLFGDFSHHLYWIINHEGPFIPIKRYSDVIAQIPTIIGIKLGLGLKSLLLIYSGSFAAIFFAIALLLIHFLRDRASAFHLIFILSVGVSFVFYWNDDIQQALAFMILLYAYIRHREGSGFSKPHYFVTIPIIVIVFFYHPIMWMMLGYLILFHVIGKGRIERHDIVHFLTCPLFALYRFFSATDYEKARFGLEVSPMKLFESPHFVRLLNDSYLPMNGIALLLLFLLIFYYLRRKKHLKILLLLAFFIPYTLLIFCHLSPKKFIYNPLHFQHYFQFYQYVIGLSIFFDVLPDLRGRKRSLLLALLVGLVTYGMYSIWENAAYYRARTAFLLSLTTSSEHPGRTKFILDVDNVPNYYYVVFGVHYPYQSLILTSILPEVRARTIVFDTDIETRRIRKEDLNPRYFHLDDSPYVELNTPCPLDRFTPEFGRGISIFPQWDPPEPMPVDHNLFLSVEIENRNEEAICSGKNDVFRPVFSYRWLQEGTFVPSITYKTPLVIDVERFHRQGIQLHTPPRKGRYTLEVGLFLEAGEQLYWVARSKGMTITVE